MQDSIVGRARFVEDIVEEKIKHGVAQYEILGAGLDTFAQRRPDIASRLHIFEVDHSGPGASITTENPTAFSRPAFE